MTYHRIIPLFLLTFLFLPCFLKLRSPTSKPQPSPRSQLTQQQMRKSICMSLSRMHIEQHMDSIQQALDSQDQDRTMKLATILDKSFRRCLRNLEMDLNKLGKNYFLGLEGERAEKEIDKVFGEVEYQRDGKLVEMESEEEGRERERSKERERERERGKKGEHQMRVRKTDLPHHKPPKQKPSKKDTPPPPQQPSNYQYSQDHHSHQQSHHHQQPHPQYPTEEQPKQLTTQPYQDITTEFQLPLQDSSKSILIYFYPILLLLALLYYRFPNLLSKLSKLTSGKKILSAKNWKQALDEGEDLTKIMLKDSFAVNKGEVKRLSEQFKFDYKMRRRILEAYIRYLNVVIHLDSNKLMIQTELVKVDREKTMLVFYENKMYEEGELEVLDAGKQLALIQKIDAMSLSPKQKRETMLDLYPYVQDHFFESINNLLSRNIESKFSYFQKYLFTKQEIDKRNETLEHLKLSSIIIRKKYVQKLADLIAGKHKNLKLAEQLIETMISDDYGKQQGKILFYLKMASVFVYKYYNISDDYLKVKKMTKTKIFSLYFKINTSKNINLKEIAPILKYLKSKDKDETEYIEENYAFTSECSLKETIQLFMLDIVKVYHRSAVCLMEKVREGKTDVGLLYKNVEGILRPYKKKLEVVEFLEILKCCEILVCYGVVREFKWIEKIVRTTKVNRAKVAEEKIQNFEKRNSEISSGDAGTEISKLEIDEVFKVYTEMISGYCSGRVIADHQLVADNKTIWDIKDPYNLLSCVRHLKRHFYGSLENMLVYDIVYGELIKSKIKYGNDLAIQKLMRKYPIDDFKTEEADKDPGELDKENFDKIYLMMEPQIEQNVKEVIESILMSASSYEGIERQIKEVLMVARSIIPQYKNPDKLELVMYLHGKGCRRAPSEIVEQADRRLYELMLENEGIKENELEGILRNITPIDSPNQRRYVREYRIKNAKKLFLASRPQQGLHQLKKIQKQIQGHHSTLLLSIMDISPQSTPALLPAAYKHIYTTSDFTHLMSKFYSHYSFPDFIRKYDSNQYPCETKIVKNEFQYKEDIKSLQNPLKEKEEYKLFFYLLGTQYEQGFYYAYKKGLDIGLVEELVGKCRKGVVGYGGNEGECDGYLEKLMWYSYEKKYGEGRVVGFGEFVAERGVGKWERVKVIVREEEVEGDKERREDRERLLRYYWRNRLSELKGMGSDSVEELRSLQGKGEIPIAQNILHQLCVQINTHPELPYLSHPTFYKNLYTLITTTPSTLHQSSSIMLRTLNKLESVAKLLTHFNEQPQIQPHTLRFDDINILLIQRLSKVQQSSEFKSLFSPSFLYTPIDLHPNPNLSSLPAEPEKIVTDSLQHSNVFLLARVLFNVYGRNPEIQKQVYRMFEEKFKEKDPLMVKKFKFEAEGEYKKYQN